MDQPPKNFRNLAQLNEVSSLPVVEEVEVCLDILKKFVVVTATLGEEKKVRFLLTEERSRELANLLLEIGHRMP